MRAERVNLQRVGEKFQPIRTIGGEAAISGEGAEPPGLECRMGKYGGEENRTPVREASRLIFYTFSDPI